MAEALNGLYEGLRASAVPCNGNLYVLVERERPVRVKETDPGTIEAKHAGIMAPNFTPSLTAAASGSKSAGEYFVRLTFFSSKNLVESDPSPAASVTVAAGQKIVIDNTGYVAPTEDGVDTIHAYVTLVNPKVETSSERGTYRFEAEISTTAFAAGTDIELAKSDEAVSGGDLLSFKNDPPPDSFLGAFWRNRLWYSGQETFTVTVSGISGKRVTVSAGTITEGLVGRRFYLQGDNIEHTIARYVNDTNFDLLETYGGGSTTGTGVIVGEGSIVYFSEIEEGFGLPGVPLPENVPRTNVALFDRDDGQNINGLIATNQLLFAFKPGKWGRIVAEGQNFTKVEDIGARSWGDANLAADDQDRVYFWADDGWRRTDGVRSQLLPDRTGEFPIRDLFDPQIETPANLQVNMERLHFSPMGYHARYRWAIGFVATGDNTNADLGLIYDLKTQRFFTFRILEGSPTATVDITRIMSVVENGVWQMYLGGKITISGTEYVGRLFKIETGYVDTSPDGTNHDIFYEFDSHDIEHPDRLTIAARECIIEQALQSGSAATITIGVIREDDDTEGSLIANSTSEPLTKSHAMRALPRVTGKSLRLRFSGSVGEENEEFQFRSITIPVYPVGSRR